MRTGKVRFGTSVCNGHDVDSAHLCPLCFAHAPIAAMTTTQHKLTIAIKDARPLWSPPDWVVDEIRAQLPATWELHTVDAPADGRGDGGAVSPEAIGAAHGAEVYV